MRDRFLAWYGQPPSSRTKLAVTLVVLAAYAASLVVLLPGSVHTAMDFIVLPVAAVGALYGTRLGVVSALPGAGALFSLAWGFDPPGGVPTGDLFLMLAVGFGFGQLRDLLDRSRFQTAEVGRSKELLMNVVRSLPMVLWQVDAGARFTLREGRGLLPLRMRPGTNLGENAREFWAVNYPEAPELISNLDRAFEGEDFSASVRIRGRTFSIHYVPIRGAVGRVTDVLGVANDVTDLFAAEAAEHRSELQRRRLDERLAYLALHDPLTDLPNRMLFRDRIDAALEAARVRRTTFAVLLLDLDTFAETNDALGQEAGDAILRQLADRLRSQMGIDDLVARIGGDEFGVLLPGADADTAREAAGSVLAELQQPFVAAGTNVYLGGTIGIVLAPSNGEDREAIIRRSHAAMYQARRARVRYRIYDPAEGDEPTPEQIQLASDLLEALEHGDIDVAFHPEISSDDGRLIRVEALARWVHPRHGIVSPSKFVAIAERLGLVGAVTATILERAVSQAARWRDAGRDIAVAVNVSASDLDDPTLTAVVAGALERHRLPALSLTVEVTESILISGLERARGQLESLRALGVTVAIDDFGTGYSSLSYLAGLPVNEIKLDRSFVRQIVDRRSALAVVRSAVALAHDLGLRVVAEGVESSRQLDLLRALRCDAVQGFLFTRPLAAAEFERWLDEREREGAGRAA